MAQKKDELTPMMRQFRTLKAKHPDALLLFRCGDFYETYADDAVEASSILGLTLTKRSNGGSQAAQNTAMAGFPHHALDTYLPRLIRAGKRVAICDQLEDPKLAKTLVKRDITELVTPGVTMDDSVLDNRQNNFLCAVHFGGSACGVAFLDISTGEFLVAEGTADYVVKLVQNFDPKEILYERSRRQLFEQLFGTGHCVFEMDEWMFNIDTAAPRLTQQFEVKNLKGFGIDHLRNAIVAAGVALYYLDQTQHTRLRHIRAIHRIEESHYVRLDNFTVRSLEIVRPMAEGGCSLLQVLDKTVCPMGARLMHRWLLFPLKDVEEIRKRQDAVEQFFRQPDRADALGEQLSRLGDMERIASKLSTLRATPRDLLALGTALEAVAAIQQTGGDEEAEGIQTLLRGLDPCPSLQQRIRREVRPDAPLQVSRGHVVREGVNAELDELRQIAYSGKDYLLKIQQREAEATGIQSLKIGFNNVFGYYLEVRNTYKHLVPQEWIRKQTLVNAERYITQELKEYEEKILGAEDKILALETQLFAQLVQDASAFIPAIQRDAEHLAQLDCLLSFAKAAKEYKYVRPVVDDSLVIDIRQGRHPVIERNMPAGETYIANDVRLDSEQQQIIVLTGPNMAGKSALLRQTALIALMAQTGAFVPAERARVGICDKIFTRVGASDNISMGESTFMVEMTEASNILNTLTPRSLVLFDELGRGTSTYDGISIAWAIVEYIHENPKARARTLFATHYHELNEMERLFPRIKNYNVAVREVDGRVIFLRKLERGGSAHSFGIHVAKMAGMAPSVVRRAEEVLRQLEANNAGGGAVQHPHTENLTAPRESTAQLSFFQLDDPVLCQIRDEILGLDINNLTPLEALNKLGDIKRIVTGK